MAIKLKQGIVFLLTAMLIASLTACGQKENTNAVGTETSTKNRTDVSSVSEEQSAVQTQEGDAQENMPSASENTGSSGSRVLIAYFSVPENIETTDAVGGASIVVRDNEKIGNTEYVAKLIQQTIGGDLLRIETVEQYPLAHDPLVEQAADEQAEGKRPELKNHVENLEQYDTIILGFPNWWADLPMPVYTFLEEYDFGAKTIIPFVTHGGSGFSGTVNTISQLQPGAHVGENTLSLSRNDVADSEEKVIAWAESLGLNAAAPVPENSMDTVAGAVADPANQQILYLWEEGNMPAVTEYTQNNGNYADDPDFRPYMVTFPVSAGTEVKGAVLINAGGAFQFRSDQNEGTPVAEELSRLGYQSFVVNYRLRPYTQEEGALDLARAVRFVRKNADAGADGMIYSFYGRLSVASTDVEKFAASDLPPTYFCYGTRDPFVGEFEECIEALQAAGVPTAVNVLDGRPHGYGYMEGWIPDYDAWLTEVFRNN